MYYFYVIAIEQLVGYLLAFGHKEVHLFPVFFQVQRAY
jgi:hypothetical protein